LPCRSITQIAAEIARIEIGLVIARSA